MALTKVTSNVITDNSVGITQLNVSDGSNGQVLTTNGSGTLSFSTVSGGVDGISSSADATAITINSSEQVGIGQSSPSNKLQIDVNSATAGTDAVSIQNSGVTGTTHTTGARFQFGTAVPSAIRTRLTNASNGEGSLSFMTSSDGTAGNLNYRMDITSAGEVLIGDTARRGTAQRGQLQVTQIDSSNAAGISAISGNAEIAGTFCLYSSGTASAMVSVDPDSARASSAFYVWIDGSERMSLNSSGNLYVSGSYSNSDIALKENIVTLSNQLEKVKQLNPVSFDWKEKAEDGSTQSSIGFIAQEIEILYPNLVSTPAEDTDAEEGSTTKYKTLNYPVMISILTKAMQEQQTIIEDLKTRIETLEG